MSGTGTGAGTEAGTVVDALAGAIDAVVAVEADALGEGDLLVELHRQAERLTAGIARACAAFDAARRFEADGARSAAAWLAGRCHRPRCEARTEVRLGRAMRHLPVAAAAWITGDIAGAHVAVLAGARTPATAARLGSDEALLVGHAKALGFADFAKAVAYWSQRADPDGAEDDEQRRHGARRAHLSQSIDGLWFANACLDPISGAIVAAELARIETALFDAEWSRAKARLGHEPTTDDLERTPAQRRADALVEMATRSASAPPGARRPVPLFSVIVGWETLHGRVCELGDGTVLAPGALIGWLDGTRLDGALLERIVFDGPSRVIDVGVAQRCFAGATRRAVEIRDRLRSAHPCFHECCDADGADCEVDHIVAWADGGPTTQANGRLACGFHNRARTTRPPPSPTPRPPPPPVRGTG